MSSRGAPPQPNPVLSAYDNFVETTPLITRYTLTSLTLSYILSFIVNPTTALANIPLLTLFRFELYRLITAPFLCTSFLTLIFAFWSFNAHGKRLEYVMGSTAFGTLLVTIGSLTNIIFTVLSVLLYAITQDVNSMLGVSLGIWTILLGIISLECSLSPEGSTRKLFAFEVKTVYYPLVLLTFFALLSGGALPIPYFISVAVGYAIGYGKLDSLKLGQVRRRKWEQGFLKNFTTRKGWVVGPSGDEWDLNAPGANNSNSGGASSNQGWTPTVFRRPPTSSNTSSLSAANTSSPNTTSSTPAFEGTKGQKLGSSSSTNNYSSMSPTNTTSSVSVSNTTNFTSQSHSADRAAILAAAERRALLSAVDDSHDEEKGN